MTHIHYFVMILLCLRIYLYDFGIGNRSVLANNKSLEYTPYVKINLQRFHAYKLYTTYNSIILKNMAGLNYDTFQDY